MITPTPLTQWYPPFEGNKWDIKQILGEQKPVVLDYVTILGINNWDLNKNHVVKWFTHRFRSL